MIINGKIISGGGSGTGILRSNDIEFETGDTVMITFIEPLVEKAAFSKIFGGQNKKEIYIPKRIVEKYNLIKKNVTVNIKKS